MMPAKFLHGAYMESTATSAKIFRFGLFEADLAQGTLTRNGIRVKIQEQPFRVLVLLLEHAGHIVSREELRHKLWPEGTFVDFDGSLNVTVKKLRTSLGDDSDNPIFIETIPRKGYRFIAPVDVTPSVQPAQAASSVAPVYVLPGSHSGAESTPQRRPSHAYYLAVAITAALLGMVGWWATRHSQTQSPVHTVAPSANPVVLRKAVAVLGFYNLTGRAEDGWLSTALSEMLNTELAAGDKLRLVAAENVTHLRLASPWPETGTLDKATTSRLGTALDSDWLLSGSYATLGQAGHQKIRFDVRLQDANSGEILTEVAEVGSTDELFQIISRIGSKLRERIHIPQLDYAGEVGVAGVLPHRPEAARFYSFGIERLREFDALAAKDLLEQASKAEPRFALTHVALGRAYGTLGYTRQYRAETRKAKELASSLPQSQQLAIEGEYWASLGRHEKAASVYHALFTLYPDNVEYGLQLASAQRMSGHGSEGLATIAELRKLPPPASDDPNIDLVEARIVPIQAEALRLIRDGLRKASSQGKRMVYARARHDECIAIIYGENPQQGTASCEEAYRTLLAAGNRLEAADCLRLIADRLGAQGRYADAIPKYREALELLHRLGDLEKTGAALNNMGEALMAEGKIAEAKSLLEEAKHDFSDAGDQTNVAVALTNMGDVQFGQGSFSAAAESYSHALDILNAVDLSNRSFVLARLSELSLAKGDLSSGNRYANQAVISAGKQASDDLATALVARGNVFKIQGDLLGARQEYEKSLEIRRTLDARAGVAVAQSMLSEIALYEGHADEAEKQLLPAITFASEQNLQPIMAKTYILLAKILLVEGKTQEADTAIVRAGKFTAATSDVVLHLSLDLQTARVQAAKGETRAALGSLKRILSRARQMGFFPLECETQFAMAEVELRSNVPAARKHLVEVASLARDRNFELLARQAERMAGR